jgi:phosphatidate cytidylyltransferase
MNNFIVRMTTGLIGAAIIIGGIFWSQWFYLALTAVVLVGGLREFFSMFEQSRKADGKLFFKYKNIIVGIALFMHVFSFLLNFRYSYADFAIFFPALIFIVFIIELYSKAEKPFENLTWNILGLIYLLMPILLLNKLYFDQGKLFVMAYIFMTWFYDSFCYIFGSLLGRTKLFERVSPKKTWEGLAGGLILTMILGYFFLPFLEFVSASFPSFNLVVPHFSQLQWVFLTAIIIIGATYGDLVESLLKRSVGVKDSGSAIPGHGGFLDRLDALLIGIPFLVLGIWFVDQWNSILLLINYLK